MILIEVSSRILFYIRENTGTGDSGHYCRFRSNCFGRLVLHHPLYYKMRSIYVNYGITIPTKDIWSKPSQAKKFNGSAVFPSFCIPDNYWYLAIIIWHIYCLGYRTGDPCDSFFTVVYPPARGGTPYSLWFEILEYHLWPCGCLTIRISLFFLEIDSFSSSQMDRMARSGCHDGFFSTPVSEKVGAEHYQLLLEILDTVVLRNL